MMVKQLKKITAIILTLCLCASLCACSVFDFRKEQTAPAPEVQATPIPTPEPTPQMPEKQPAEIYAPVIEKYYQAALAKMSMEDLVNSGLNYMAAYCYGDAPLEKLGVLLYDLDGDGVQELFVGSRTGDEYQDKIVLEMYAIRDGEAVNVFSSGERQRYYLRSDGSIANENSNSAFESSYNIYVYSNGELGLSEALIFDMAADRNAPWFLVTAEGKTGIDEAAATAKINQMQETYVMLDYSPLSGYAH